MVLKSSLPIAALKQELKMEYELKVGICSVLKQVEACIAAKGEEANEVNDTLILGKLKPIGGIISDPVTKCRNFLQPEWQQQPQTTKKKTALISEATTHHMPKKKMSL